MNIVYADNNATTRAAPEVLEAMQPYLSEIYFNPSSMYDAANAAADAVAGARREIAGRLGAADPKEILFTSCATESNNTAIRGVAAVNRGRRHIVTTSVEHPAVLEVCREMERQGHDVTYLAVDRSGRLDVREFIRALRADTLLVTIMYANNETGVIFPVDQLARIAKETDPEIIVHSDATQSVGKLPIDLAGEFGHVDLLSFSGHKLHAPKGVGGLYIRRGTPCKPFLIGGHQEEGRRGGTENVAYIVGLARALALAAENHEAVEERVRRLRDKLEQELQAKIPYTEVNGVDAPRLSNTSNLSCHYIEGEGMLYQLSAHGICASSGSACTSGSLEPSHVLRAMQVPFTAVHGSIRFSFSRYTTPGEIDRIVEVFPPIVTSLRRLSPYWDTVRDAPRPDAKTLLEGNLG
ncbi:MAG: cysteine desulfurase NifS [Candidatus Eisenbacteria bacterium]|nr:cysteine desulfurase NifS [Candidatus Eisenbacteria bacterium]